jgi:Lrp/AsnC family leucine-responsive transcriptional regulator
MDKLDYLIISELCKDAQLSFVTIAKKLGITPYTVRKRYERMKKEGIIQKSIVSIDLSKLGYQGKAFLMITVSAERDKSLTISSIKKISNVMLVQEIIGAFDILALAPVIDLNSIRTLVNEIKKVPNVQKVEITCINDTFLPINQSFGELLSRKSYELATS